MTQCKRVGRIVVAALGLASVSWSCQSAASTIVAPVTAVTTSQFISKHKDYDIENTIDQSGLLLGYESGVTDFDSYLASKPMHTSKSDGNEWYSEDFRKTGKKKSSKKLSQKLQNGKTKDRSSKKNLPKNSSTINASAIIGAPLLSIIYDFKRAVGINGFVLWNEEFAGIGTTELWSSTDGNTYALLKTITPEPSKFAKNGQVVPYLAQFFQFELTTMMFFKLLVYDCPGPPAKESNYKGCGIGEVAFSADIPSGPVDNNPIVPLPAALPLLGSARGVFIWIGRRRKARN